jgi:hypothetical protein
MDLAHERQKTGTKEVKRNESSMSENWQGKQLRQIVVMSQTETPAINHVNDREENPSLSIAMNCISSPAEVNRT